MSALTFGIYVHWPFCTRICPYCDFNVYRDRGLDSAALAQAMIDDLRGQSARIGPRQADTIFFGGGTPSLLSGDFVAAFIEAVGRVFSLARDVEITLEANPEDRSRFPDFVAAGVNRLSVGVQALRDDALKSLGRAHDAAGGRAAVERAASTGARVSADFIYARHDQTIDDWRAELGEALDLPAEHFSLYELTIKPRTAYERAVRRGRLAPPGDELAARFYEATQMACDEAGLPAYEISNHARHAGARARHNMIYWRGGEWLGIGPGAHGRVAVGGVRTATKTADRPADYIARVNRQGDGLESAAPLSAAEDFAESLLMGLRVRDGVERSPSLDAGKLEDLAREGLVLVSAERVALTPRGRLLADRIALELCP